MKKITDWWNNISPEDKAKYTKFAIFIFVFGVILISYRIRQGDAPKTIQPEAQIKPVEINLDKNLYETAAYEQMQANLDKFNSENRNLSTENEQLKRQLNDLKTELIKKETTIATQAQVVQQQPKEVKSQSQSIDTQIPPPPSVAKQNYPPSTQQVQDDKVFKTSHPPNVSNAPNAPIYKLVGDIETIKEKDTQSSANKEKKATEEGEKKKDNTIYLPPSFMEATLLSGVAAKTTKTAKSEPVPLILRIKDLAVLPNKVKANLKGCFVIGEGMGNLSDERVHIRLTTLSCVAKNGSAVIDQEVNGFVVDEDGKVGLKGNVVAKMGVHVARSALAGFIGGVGEGVNQSSQSSTMNAIGQQQIFSQTDASTIARGGIGKGISTAASELQKFYLQLAEQTLPVVEVGATKDLTIVISKGVDLMIKEKK
ncbi:MAG: conjugal transfer protein TraB [Desulfobacterales bacterium]|nr:conjugal transfer protein TraB [Desulfobacterales bacterium]